MTKGMIYRFKDAKESGLFTDIVFGILEKQERKVDPVMLGDYKGQELYCPLGFWK